MKKRGLRAIKWNNKLTLYKCPSVDEWIKKLVHLHNGILHSREKEGTSALCDSMDGTGEHMLSEISQVVKDEYL